MPGTCQKTSSHVSRANSRSLALLENARTRRRSPNWPNSATQSSTSRAARGGCSPGQVLPQRTFLVSRQGLCVKSASWAIPKMAWHTPVWRCMKGRVYRVSWGVTLMAQQRNPVLRAGGQSGAASRAAHGGCSPGQVNSRNKSLETHHEYTEFTYYSEDSCLQSHKSKAPNPSPLALFTGMLPTQSAGRSCPPPCLRYTVSGAGSPLDPKTTGVQRWNCL